MLLTSLCVPVPRPMPFPPASAHAALKFMLLHSPSHFYFPFLQLSSLFPLPFFNAVQPFFFPCMLLNVRGKKKKRPTHLKGRVGTQARGRAMPPGVQVPRRAGQVAVLSVHSKQPWPHWESITNPRYSWHRTDLAWSCYSALA